MFLSIGWIILYIKTITRNSPAVFSPPLILFSLLSAATFLLLLVLFWRHNQFAYKRRYSQWERSFFCQPCGTLTERSEEHTSELQSHSDLVCRLLLEKKNTTQRRHPTH